MCIRDSLSPVFTPEQEAVKRRELEQQLYEVFRKYADKRQMCIRDRRMGLDGGETGKITFEDETGTTIESNGQKLPKVPNRDLRLNQRKFLF